MRDIVEKSVSRWRHVMVGVASWLVFAAAVPPMGWTVLAFFALVPWLVWIRTAPEKGFLHGYVAGTFVYGLYHFQWLWQLEGWGGAVALVIMSTLFTVLIMPCAWLLRRLVVRRQGSLLLFVPLVFTAHDILRGPVIGGITWDTAGYALAPWTLLIQISEHTRVWGLTLLVYASNALLAEIWLRSRHGKGPDRRRLFTEGVGLLVVVALLALYGSRRIAALDEQLEDGPALLGVQTNIAVGERRGAGRRKVEERWSHHLDLIAKATRDGFQPDLVVWPETASLYPVDQSSLPRFKRRGITLDQLLNGTRSNGQRMVDEFAAAMHRKVGSEKGPRHLLGVSLVDDLPEGEWDEGGQNIRNRNTALYLEERGGRLEEVGAYHKRKLVPAGEYLPPRWLPGRAGLRRSIEKLAGFVPDMLPGSDPGHFQLPGVERDWKFSVNICFEAVYPWIFREASSAGCDFIVNISNDNWFGLSSEVDLVHSHLKFRAIENRLSIFRVSNTGISALLDPVGREKAVVKKGDSRKGIEGILAVVVPVGAPQSGYVGRGDWFGALVVCLAVAAIVNGLFFNRRG